MIKLQLFSGRLILRNTDLSQSKWKQRARSTCKESEGADYEEELSDSSMHRLEEQFGQELYIPSEVEEELKRQDREKKKLERRELEKNSA